MAASSTSTISPHLPSHRISSDEQHLSEGQEKPPVHTNGMNGGFDEVANLNERRRLALEEIDQATFSKFHIKLCLVAGVGFLTDAYDIFTINIAATMLGFVYGPGGALSVWQIAGLKLATPAGNLIGQLFFGWLADVLGRKRVYGIELIIMITAAFGQAVSGQGPVLSIVNILIVWRIIMGIGVGGDYPLSAVITSEFASKRIRGRLMTAVFSTQGVGQLFAALVGLVAVAAFKDPIETSVSRVDYTWRLLIGFGCVPATVALYFRLTLPETPRFTMDIARKISRAAHDIRTTLTRPGYTIYVDEDIVDELRVIAPRSSGRDFLTYFSNLENLKVLFGVAYSWFALDVAFYFLTLNSDMILTLVDKTIQQGTIYQRLVHICRGNIILTLGGYIPGFILSYFLIDILGRKPIQMMGFVILTILFWIIAFDLGHLYNDGSAFMTLICLANFFQNFGPNTTTFIVPGEVFPTRYRATAHGISAASGKLGAVIAQIVFAVITSMNPTSTQQAMGTMLKVLSFVMMTGVFSTLLIPETNQRTLEELSNEDQEHFITGWVPLEDRAQA